MDDVKVRIDKYLWSIRIFKTRALAAAACNSNRVSNNDKPVKASRVVQIGEIYKINTSERKWVIKVLGILKQRRPYSEAILNYQDLTPEEDKAPKEKMTSSFYTGKRLSKTGKPNKKERRDLDDFFGVE